MGNMMESFGLRVFSSEEFINYIMNVHVYVVSTLAHLFVIQMHQIQQLTWFNMLHKNNNKDEEETSIWSCSYGPQSWQLKHTIKKGRRNKCMLMLSVSTMDHHHDVLQLKITPAFYQWLNMKKIAYQLKRHNP